MTTPHRPDRSPQEDPPEGRFPPDRTPALGTGGTPPADVATAGAVVPGAVSRVPAAAPAPSPHDGATADGVSDVGAADPASGSAPPDAELAGETGGETARTAVGRLAATVRRLRQEVWAAQAAADGRALLDLARGILIERLGLGPVEAARHLTALAEQAGVEPLELAVDVINQAARDRLSEVAAEFLAEATEGGPGIRGGSRTASSAVVRLRTAESGALAAADAQAVADSLLQHALAPLGACTVAVWAARSDGSLALAGSAGFSAAEAERWCYVPPGVATVARRALTERGTRWYASLDEAGVPTIGHTEFPHGGRVAVPAGTGGRIHGVLEIGWASPLAPQPPRIVRQVEALAELCAHTLETHTAPAVAPGEPHTRPGVSELVHLAEGLHDPALVLVPCSDEDGHLLDFRIHYVNSRFLDPAGRPRGAVNGALLLEAYPMAAGQSELFQQIERVYATGEPFRAQRMTLTALVEQVPLSAVADVHVSRHGSSLLFIWRIEDETARLASLLQHAQRLGRIGGFEENLLTDGVTWNSQLYALFGRPSHSLPVRLQDLPAHAHPDDAVALGRFLRTLLHHRRPASVAFRLQRPDGVTRHMRVVAEPVLDTHDGLLAVRGAYQDISAQHWTEVALAATRDQLAHTEQESAERNRLALQLQHAIMPPAQAPLEIPQLQLAVRYRPAETEQLVGGDWYDAVVLPSGKVLLCVGDVAGHGIDAATSMVVLRNALRGLAVTGAGPAQILSWLNMVAHHLAGAVTATAVCALYDPLTRSLRWARAGHLPPVLVRDAEATALPLVRGLLLGAVAETTYEEAEVRLAPDDTLLMYTDGLIERRDLPVEESLAHLLTTAGTPASALPQQLDRLLTYSRSDTDDDTCIVGIRVL
ncbi:transcription antitermination regulator [Streptomyces griseoaurantiacus]|nr:MULTISPECIES: SpoIIE family protein phosphatase [Streptomyces]MDX3092279.1 SpoIIE family protein phosphatase [Streptomyces sp. ME12-02E]MDX3335620.1 SpoIIE family protein phosphatase [Streptomyces sp. ME02-6978a]GHE44294.1 transcription antitermination regulator [Streptomyces griseoaurantiacus]